MSPILTLRWMVLAALLQLFGAPVPQQQPAQPGRIEGQVVDALTGRPVSNVTVMRGNLAPTGLLTSADYVALGNSLIVGPASATTDNDGRFVLESVVPGSVSFTVRRLGYIDSKFDRPGPGDTPLTMVPGQTLKDVVLRLTPAAIALGRVVDLKGDPVTFAQVFAFRYGYDDLGEVTPRVLISQTTDDRGEFRFNMLSPGTYGFRVERNLVRFGQANPASFYPTYYPGTRDLRKASTVTLEAGKETRLSDILLNAGRGGILSVRIRRDANAGTNTQVVIWRSGEPVDTTVGGLPPEGGVVGQLPPGTYQIEVETGQSRGYATAELGAQDLMVDIQVPNPAVIVGKAGVGDPRDPERFKPVQGVRLQLMDTLANNSNNRPTLISGVDGRFTNPPSVKPGLFHVQSFFVPAGTYLLGVRLGDREVFGEKFSIDRGSIDLNAILGEGPGVVRGTVRDAGGNAVPGAMVALLPEDRTQKALVISKAADTNGVFELQCAPGVYRLFAWKELDGAAYRNVDFMKSFDEKGTAIRIGKDERLNVDLKVLDGTSTAAVRP